MKIVYLVHDLNDPAVERRMRMLTSVPGVRVSLAGFHRGSAGPMDVAGFPVMDFGQTYDAKLKSRIFSLVMTALRMPNRQKLFTGADLILARNLEMLVLAAFARRRQREDVGLVYECLDVHGLMRRPGVLSAGLRALERALLRRCSGLVVSSPAFLQHHFRKITDTLPRYWLLENKLLEEEVCALKSGSGDTDGRPAARGESSVRGTARVIGWFGNLRCSRSLEILGELCRLGAGEVEVVIRGRVARDQLPDFEERVEATPNMRFEGEYDRATDLPEIYGEVDFVWAMDFFQAGFNSDWLLPNRLYEGVYYGAVPVASAGTQTAEWLSARSAGFIVDDATGPALWARLRNLTDTEFADHLKAVDKIEDQDLLIDSVEKQRFLDELSGVLGRRVFE